MELKGHIGSANCLEWSPSHRGLIAAGGDDCLALVWDVYNGLDGGKAPIMGYQADHEVNGVSWSPTGTNKAEWLGVASGRGLTGVRCQ